MAKRVSTALSLALVFVLSLCGSAAIAVDTEAYLARWVTEEYHLDTTRTRIEIVHNALDTRMVDPEDVTVKALSKRSPRGPFTVLVTITDGDTRVDRGQVRMRVSHYAEVLVSTADIDRHDEVMAENFTKQLMDITSLREQPVTTPDDLAGHRATTNIRPGAILTAACIEPVPDIEVGGEVTITYRDGACTITAPGKALQTGWKGDRVRVRNMATGKSLAAEVVDGRSVLVKP